MFWRAALVATMAMTWATTAALGATPTTLPAAAPAYRQANQVAVLPIEGEIDAITLSSLERRVRKALDEGADAIVFDINTPGGDMLATLDITHRSPRTIGEECASPGIAVFQRTLLPDSTFQDAGTAAESSIPPACGPRNCGQSAATGDATPRKRMVATTLNRDFMSVV
jgi:hypothetical protein